jgi:uncharacterized membrane protein
MTALPSSRTRSLIARASAQSMRADYADVFRGLLIAHMALDHASLMFNAGRAAEELAGEPPPVFDGIWQFLTRFSGVPVAPGFFFMAGFMVALTSAARLDRGVSSHDLTRRLLARGLVLILADALIMGLPRLLMGFYSFAVLSSIGVGLIVLALVRNLPTRVLLPAALAVVFLHPLLDVSELPIALQAVLHEPVRVGAFRSLYPIIPWSAILIVGYVVGRTALHRERPARLWLLWSAVSLIAFAIVRLTGGYGNAYDYPGIVSQQFWVFAKYPPDLAFLTWSSTIVFLTLAIVWRLTRDRIPLVLRPFQVFGRVPFFFYLVHFYVLGIAAAIVRTKVDLAGTYAIWLALLIVMTWPCLWYYRRKTERPNLITRYL